MKPAPFEGVDYVDPDTRYHVKSHPSGSEQGEGFTEVLDPSGKPLWKYPVFAGRKLVRLSPEGRVLLLYGNYWFGSLINVSGDELMVSVFRDGREGKKIHFSDLFWKNAKTLSQERNLSVKGGGWVSLHDFVTHFEVDWKASAITFTLYDKSTKKLSF